MLGNGPFFEDLAAGQEITKAPGLTLTEGLAVAHQAVTGGRLALALDHELCRSVTGRPAPLAPPELVWDVAIGQSTIVTRHVKANLFYRGLAFRGLPSLGDTIRTVTRVVALRQNRPREGRSPTGLVALRITTTDQHGRPVLDFWRCAMVPLRDPLAQTGHADDLEQVGQDAPPPHYEALVAGWDLEQFARRTRGPRPADLHAGQVLSAGAGDVVTSAPELARLTLNVAIVHHDSAAADGQRLVYGGHVIGLALAQATRVLPSLVTVAGWERCDHLAPVREGDTLHSSLTVEQIDLLPGGGSLARLRSLVRSGERSVLDWNYTAIIA